MLLGGGSSHGGGGGSSHSHVPNSYNGQGTPFNYTSGGKSNSNIPSDGSQMTVNEVLDAAQNFLGNTYIEESSGRFTSSGGIYQVRMLDVDLAEYNNHAGAPHVNFEIWGNDPYRPGRMYLIEKSHVFLLD